MCTRVVTLIFLSLVVVYPLIAQEVTRETAPGGAVSISSPVVSKERQLKLLQLEEAKLKLENAENTYKRMENDLERMKALYEGQYVSGQLYEQSVRSWEAAKTEYDNARLGLQRTKLNFLQDASRISVVEAAQRINKEGTRVLDFTLMNTSSATDAMVTDEDLKDVKRIEALLRIENVRVTVLSDKTQIGKPFEIEIPFLDYGQTYKGTFELQQEKVEAVTLRIEYLIKVDERVVYLEKQSGEDIVRVTSLQFAQEGNAGESVLFDLELERLAETGKTFALEVVNAPEYIRSRFEEKGKQLSQVKFAERVGTRNLELRCYVPEELGQEFLDKPINFFVIVGDERAVNKLKALGKEKPSQPITEQQIAEMKVGYEALQLTPRGRPELQLAAPNLYFEIDPGEPVNLRIVVRNTGTVALRDVRVETEIPNDWTAVIKPELLDKIERKNETPVDIKVILPKAIGTGIYDMQVVAKCQYEGEPVESPKKDVRINVKSRVNVIGTAIVVTLLVAAMAGVAVFTIRLARR